jgi:hypothetical protein
MVAKRALTAITPRWENSMKKISQTASYALLGVGVAALASIGMTLPGLAPPAAASGHPEASRSRIVWSQFVDQDFSGARIVSARPDGARMRTLSHPGTGVVDLDPVVSPDGTQVAFERDYPDRSQVVIVDSDGNHEHVFGVRCEDPCAGVGAPSWSPDGRRLVFDLVIGPFDQPNDSATSAVMWTAKLDGTDVRRLSEPGIDGRLEDSRARYSPDGSYLIFERLDNLADKAAVFRMQANGTRVRQLTPWSLGADTADLSQARRGRTKDLVVFETYGHGERPAGVSEDLATVPTTCRSVTRCADRIRYLTHNGAGPRHSNNPAFSPDGTHVAFVQYDDETPESAFTYADIFTVDVQGHHRRQVSRSPNWDFRPDW